MSRYFWKPYVPVGVRRARAARQVAAMSGRGTDVQPVVVEGRRIARTFWGEAWCDHLERFSDFANRLPRGRTYVRNGSVCHLEIAEGVVRAMVCGSDIYDVAIEIDPLPSKQWRDLKGRCAGQIGSLLELLQGRLSDRVMGEVCDPERGLFPKPRQIHLSCSCPDWAVMCKHVAAVLYGVGARLDEQPELLFVLRGVDHEELIGAEAGLAVTTAGAGDGRRRIAEEDLGDVFGIELSPEAPVGRRTSGRRQAPGAKRGSRSPHSKGQDGAVSSGPRTGKEVARLRKRFGMSQNEFALLLGVSGVTVLNWERSPRSLRPLIRVRQVWPDVVALTPEEASICLETLSENDHA